MQKITHFELRIIDALAHKDQATERAFEKMLEYFSIYDQLEQTSHHLIIVEIYRNRRQSLISLSLKSFISDRTLIRYRKKYLECFSLFYNKQRASEEAAIAK